MTAQIIHFPIPPRHVVEGMEIPLLAPVLSAMRDVYRAPARREEIASVLGLGRDSEGEAL